MLKIERYRSIEEMLEKKEVVSVSEIEKALNISRATIYRDIKELSQSGALQIVRGGISKWNSPSLLLEESIYSDKLRKNTEEKARIAEYAASLIDCSKTIFLDSSTTVFEMCPFIKQKKDLLIITNDVRIAAEFSTSPGISVYVLGGWLRPNYYTLRDRSYKKVLADISIDLAFFSCDAITPQRGCMITNDDEVLLKKEIISISSHNYVLSDHSKFNKTAFMAFSALDAFDKIISGIELDEEYAENFHVKGINLVLV